MSKLVAYGIINLRWKILKPSSKKKVIAVAYEGFQIIVIRLGKFWCFEYNAVGRLRGVVA